MEWLHKEATDIYKQSSNFNKEESLKVNKALFSALSDIKIK